MSSYERSFFLYWPSAVHWENEIWGGRDGKGVTLAYKPYRYDFMTETELAEIQRKYGAVMNTIRDTFFLKAVTGQADIDAEWDDYVNEWLNNGGSEYLKELEKAPILEEFLKGNLVY